ncbi:MAG: DUF4242 domain-containing protein [Thermoflexus sp.]|uniref:DUF4242 domain-containing protein n=1 Tax=Thermoflexus sp. TaxID=1969742 RepID=UPI0025FB0990|nr:DUF4242 domain-containing protein [Thermoflexus sp.]MCS6965037.1 DUF4242 domain-containing protein [Thermoflexus sp.]MCS7351755.1 DUF4242 domain-containing protein [Thermoflexus sp.]MDW8181214.1 DUF4242 domain-containing protein [Anaerolineae bacterium]MDW8184390.1 DUF4242 domain-containing protein [Anaerolineae bacterium]
MPIFLLESALPNGVQRTEIRAALDRLAQAARRWNAELIEAQVASDHSRFFAILEAPVEDHLRHAAREADFATALIKSVRLVGQELEEARATRATVDYVVEWNFPPGLTMEAYLQRKKANSPRYAQVPEVKFLRTYVCEDMSKCLCFYEAETVEDVLRARQVVEAPADAVTRVENLDA